MRDHVRTIAAVSRLLCAGALLCAATAAAQSSQLGQWSAVQSWPGTATHNHLLPTGQVLSSPEYSQGDNPVLWNPATNAFTTLPKVGYNIFCAGHTLLLDGTVFIGGGQSTTGVGMAGVSRFDPATNSWSRLPDMNNGRWYPTVTALANGDVLVSSGDIDTNSGVNNTIPQVWQPALGQWRDLTGANRALELYPYMFLLPDGRVFNAGPAKTSLFLGTAGTGAWTSGPTNTFGMRRAGSAVLYGRGKVMIVGGSNEAVSATPTNTAEVIDLTAAAPAWRRVGSMAHARRHLTATLLPDGTVLATGGSSSGATFNDSSAPVLEAELWNPATEQWTTLSAGTRYRGYHSTALLLPDARVLVSGGESELSAEIFSPPYLFKSARPVIASAPADVDYGQTFSVGTASAGAIARVTLVRLASVTHGFNQNQRISELSFQAGTDALQATAPPNSNEAPPGHYMLFLLNADGVPSVARVVRLGAASTPLPLPPPAPTPSPDAVSFSDDFDACTSTTDLGSRWAISTGTWYCKSLRARGEGASGGVALASTVQLQDTDVRALVQLNSNDGSGVVARAQAGTYYAARLRSAGRVEIVRVSGGGETVLAGTAASIALNTSYLLRLQVTGTSPVHLTADFKGTRVLSVDDASASSLAAGLAGLLHGSGFRSQFDNFTLSGAGPAVPPPPPPSTGGISFSDNFDLCTSTSDLGPNWQTSGKWYCQSLRARGESALGTAIAKSAALGDTDVSALVQLNGSTGSGVFARSANGSFYAARLLLDGHVDLVRIDGATVTTLGSVAREVLTNTSYTLRLQVSGTSPVQLVASVGGTPLLSASDASAGRLARGQAGLLSGANIRTQFDKFVLTGSAP